MAEHDIYLYNMAEQGVNNTKSVCPFKKSVCPPNHDTIVIHSSNELVSSFHQVQPSDVTTSRLMIHLNES